MLSRLPLLYKRVDDGHTIVTILQKASCFFKPECHVCPCRQHWTLVILSWNWIVVWSNIKWYQYHIKASLFFFNPYLTWCWLTYPPMLSAHGLLLTCVVVFIFVGNNIKQYCTNVCHYTLTNCGLYDIVCKSYCCCIDVDMNTFTVIHLFPKCLYPQILYCISY